MTTAISVSPSGHHVVVLGASPKPTRYSNRAVRLLQQQGYRVTPIHPRCRQIEGLAVVDRLERVERPVDTLTLYLGPVRLNPLIDPILELAPRRVIFNPGSELTALEQRLDQAGIPWLHACTLVLLSIGTF
jgi:predicted CoA-binding protein